MTFERTLWQEMKRPRYWLAVVALAAAIVVFTVLWLGL